MLVIGCSKQQAMPIESGGKPLPFRPENHTAFHAGLPGGGGAHEERRNPFGLDRPVDLVGNIRALVTEARSNWREREPFNPALWLGDNLKSLKDSAWFQGQASGAYAMPPQERVFEEEKHDLLWGLQVAWYLVAYREVDGEHNHRIFHTIRSYSSAYQVRSVTLPPLGVMLLDAMAEALDIPYTPGQSEFNVDPLLRGAIDKVMRQRKPPMPSAEEVRQAITPKPEHLIDAEQ
jgi:hypothetical protein